MARQFVLSSSQYLYGSNGGINALPLTIAARIFIPTGYPTSQDVSFVSVSNQFDFPYVALGFRPGTPRVQAMSRDALNATAIAQNTTAVTADAWHSAAAVFASTTSRRAYFNKVESSENTTSNDSVPAGWDTITIGAINYAFGQIYYAQASIAEAAIWNAALSKSEIDMLADGYTPAMIRPQNLVFYCPLHGRNGASGNEEDWFGGRVMTHSVSPALASHPRVIYPTRGQRIYVKPYVAPSFKAAWAARRMSQVIGAR